MTVRLSIQAILLCCSFTMPLSVKAIEAATHSEGETRTSEPAAGHASCAATRPVAVAQGADGTSYHLTARKGTVTLQIGRPHADTLDVQLSDPAILVGSDKGILSTGAADAGVAALLTDQGSLLVVWSEEEKTWASTCNLQQEADRALQRRSWTTPTVIASGRVSSANWDSAGRRAVVATWSPADQGTIQVAFSQDENWRHEIVTTEARNTQPQVCVSDRGTVHVVWRDSDHAVWHLQNRNMGEDSSAWLRSGGTSHRPEQIGTSHERPSVTATRHQLLVALTSADQQIEYSLFTGQSWETNRPCTRSDKRWNDDQLSQPQLVVDGLGTPWLFFVNNTGKRQYLYYTRWLGFDWDTIRKARGIFHVTEEFLDCLAPIESYAVPGHLTSNHQEISLALFNPSIPRPLRPYRIATPTPVARPGTDILFLDMLDVGRSCWTEQVLQSATKHADAPLLRPSGDPATLDSHRVFNGGNVIRDEDGYKAWYGALNPEGDWFADNGQAWKSMLYLCYATSPDGIVWTKPNLGLTEYNGSTDNNALGVSTDLSSELRFFHGPIRVMRNPDQSNPEQKYLSVPPGYVSADGLSWQRRKVTFHRPGPDPKWVDFHSMIYDPDAPESRRWKAWGCTCTNEPPVLRSICYAWSADGVNWTEDPENPILLAETSGRWNKAHDVGTCHYKGHYLLLYQTANGYDHHLELAVSRDGRNFVRVHDGQSIIEQGKGDAFDRGLHLPCDPIVTEDGIRLYYGAANYRAPDDPPFEFPRWKNCQIQLGLATLPVDGWTYIRNRPGRNVGYVTTVPMRHENLNRSVLTLNVQCKDKGHLLAELLDAETLERIPGYEMENCDPVTMTGTEQVVTWKGKAGLDGVDGDRVRVRVILVGTGDLRLYSIGIREDQQATAPAPQKAADGLTETSLQYESSVSDLSPLKSWVAFQPDGKPKPLLVLMHGFGEPVYRHGGRRMRGSVQYYARKGLFAIGVDLRGREESAGQRDNGGVEVMDIYDAVQAALEQYPDQTDAQRINILGWSGGGGNTFSAVTRMPDLFSNAGAFYGITDYGHWAETAFKGVLEPDIGGTPQQVPHRYAARNSLLGVANNALTTFHFFWDEDETICPVWMDEEYRRLAQELNYTNITAHESKRTDEFRWLHSGASRATGAEAQRIMTPLFTEGHNPGPQISASGRLMVLGYLMTKRFRTLFGHGNDAAVEVEYDLQPNEYRFRFVPHTVGASVRGWLQITDRPASDVVRVTVNDEQHPWHTSRAGHILIRDLAPQDRVTVSFERVSER